MLRFAVEEDESSNENHVSMFVFGLCGVCGGYVERVGIEEI